MITVQPYEDLQDISLKLYGTADALVALAKGNALGLDAVLTSAQVLTAPAYTELKSNPELLKPYVPPMVTGKNKLQSYQNLTDLSVQEFGSADALVMLCKLNNLALDAELTSGTELMIGTPVRKSLINYLKQRRKAVITGRDADAGLALPLILSEDDMFFVADEETGQAILQN
jgi:hypothetical protein